MEKLSFDLSIDVQIVKQVRQRTQMKEGERERGNLCCLGDVGLTQEGFMAVAGEIGNGVTDVEWHFI